MGLVLSPVTRTGHESKGLGGGLTVRRYLCRPGDPQFHPGARRRDDDPALVDQRPEDRAARLGRARRVGPEARQDRPSAVDALLAAARGGDRPLGRYELLTHATALALERGELEVERALRDQPIEVRAVAFAGFVAGMTFEGASSASSAFFAAIAASAFSASFAAFLASASAVP